MDVGRNLTSELNTPNFLYGGDDEEDDEGRFVIALDSSDQDESFDERSDGRVIKGFSSNDTSNAVSENVHKRCSMIELPPGVKPGISTSRNSSLLDRASEPSTIANVAEDDCTIINSQALLPCTLDGNCLTEESPPKEACRTQDESQKNTFLSRNSFEEPKVPDILLNSPEIIKILRSSTSNYQKIETSSANCNESNLVSEVNSSKSFFANCDTNKSSTSFQSHQIPLDHMKEKDMNNVFAYSGLKSPRSQDTSFSLSRTQFSDSSSHLNGSTLQTPFSISSQLVMSTSETPAVCSGRKNLSFSQASRGSESHLKAADVETDCSSSSILNSVMNAKTNVYPIVFSNGNYFVITPKTGQASGGTAVVVAPGISPIPVVCRLIPQVYREGNKALALTKNFIQSCRPDLRIVLRFAKKVDLTSPNRVYIFMGDVAGKHVVSPSKLNSNVVIQPSGKDKHNPLAYSGKGNVGDVLLKMVNSHLKIRPLSDADAVVTRKNASVSTLQSQSSEQSHETITAKCLSNNLPPHLNIISSPFQNKKPFSTSNDPVSNEAKQGNCVTLPLPPPPPLVRCPTTFSMRAPSILKTQCNRISGADEVKMSAEPKETLVIPLQRNEANAGNVAGDIKDSVEGNDHNTIDLTSDLYTFTLPNELSPEKTADSASIDISQQMFEKTLNQTLPARNMPSLLSHDVPTSVFTQQPTSIGESNSSTQSSVPPTVTVNLSSSANFIHSSPTLTSSRQNLNKVLEKLMTPGQTHSNKEFNPSSPKRKKSKSEKHDMKEKGIYGPLSKEDSSGVKTSIFVPSILQRNPDFQISARSPKKLAKSPLTCFNNSGLTYPISTSTIGASCYNNTPSCVSKSSSVYIPSTCPLQTSSATLPVTTSTVSTSESSILPVSSSSLLSPASPAAFVSSSTSSTSLSADGLKLKIRLKDVKDNGRGENSKCDKDGPTPEASIKDAEHSKDLLAPNGNDGAVCDQFSSESIPSSESTQPSSEKPSLNPGETAEEMFQRFQDQAKQQVYNAQFGVGDLSRSLRRPSSKMSQSQWSFLKIKPNNVKKNKKPGELKTADQPCLSSLLCQPADEVKEKPELKVTSKSRKKRHSSSENGFHVPAKEPRLDINSFRNLRQDNHSILVKKTIFTPNIMAAHKVFVKFNIFDNAQSERCFLVPFFNLGGSRVQFDFEDMDYIKKAVIEVEKEEKFCARHLLYYSRENNKATFVRKENLHHKAEVNDKSYKKCSYILEGFTRESTIKKSAVEPNQWKVDKKVSIEIDTAECGHDVAIDFENNPGEMCTHDSERDAFGESSNNMRDEVVGSNSDWLRKETLVPKPSDSMEKSLDRKPDFFSHEGKVRVIQYVNEGNNNHGSIEPCQTRKEAQRQNFAPLRKDEEWREPMQHVNEDLNGRYYKESFDLDPNICIEKTFVVGGSASSERNSPTIISVYEKETPQYSKDRSSPLAKNCDNINGILLGETAINSEATFTDQLKELFASGILEKTIPSVDNEFSYSKDKRSDDSEKDQSGQENLKAPLTVPIKSEIIDKEYEQSSQTTVGNSKAPTKENSVNDKCCANSLQNSETFSSVDNSLTEVRIKPEPVDEYFDSLERSFCQTETMSLESAGNLKNHGTIPLSVDEGTGEKNVQETQGESLNKDSQDRKVIKESSHPGCEEQSEETESACTNSPLPSSSVSESSEMTSSSDISSSDESEQDLGDESENFAVLGNVQELASSSLVSLPDCGIDSSKPLSSGLSNSVNTKITSLVESLKQRLHENSSSTSALPSIFSECMDQEKIKGKKKKRKKEKLLKSKQFSGSTPSMTPGNVKEVSKASGLLASNIDETSGEESFKTTISMCHSRDSEQSHLNSSASASSSLLTSVSTSSGTVTSSMPISHVQSVSPTETSNQIHEDLRQKFSFITSGLDMGRVSNDQQVNTSLQSQMPNANASVSSGNERKATAHEFEPVTGIENGANSVTKKSAEFFQKDKQASCFSCTYVDILNPTLSLSVDGDDSESDIDVGTECVLPETSKAETCVSRWLLSSPPLSANGKTHIKDFTRENEFVISSKKSLIPSESSYSEENTKIDKESIEASPKKFSLPLRPRTAVRKKKVKSPMVAPTLSVASKLCQKLDIAVEPLAPKLKGKIVTPLECNINEDMVSECMSPSPLIPKPINPTFKPSINAIFGVENIPSTVISSVHANVPADAVATEVEGKANKTHRQVAKKGIAKQPKVNFEKEQSKKDQIQRQVANKSLAKQPQVNLKTEQCQEDKTQMQDAKENIAKQSEINIETEQCKNDQTQRQVAKKSITKQPKVGNETVECKKDQQTQGQSQVARKGITKKPKASIEIKEKLKHKASFNLKKKGIQLKSAAANDSANKTTTIMSKDGNRSGLSKKGSTRNVLKQSDMCKKKLASSKAHEAAKENLEKADKSNPLLEFDITPCKVLIERLEQLDWGDQGEPTVTESGSYILKDVTEEKKPKISSETVRKRKKKSILQRSKKNRQVKPKKDIVDYYAAAIESLRRKALMLQEEETSGKTEGDSEQKKTVFVGDIKQEVEDTDMVMLSTLDVSGLEEEEKQADQNCCNDNALEKSKKEESGSTVGNENATAGHHSDSRLLKSTETSNVIVGALESMNSLEKGSDKKQSRNGVCIVERNCEGESIKLHDGFFQDQEDIKEDDCYDDLNETPEEDDFQEERHDADKNATLCGTLKNESDFKDNNHPIEGVELVNENNEEKQNCRIDTEEANEENCLLDKSCVLEANNQSDQKTDRNDPFINEVEQEDELHPEKSVELENSSKEEQQKISECLSNETNRHLDEAIQVDPSIQTIREVQDHDHLEKVESETQQSKANSSFNPLHDTVDSRQKLHETPCSSNSDRGDTFDSSSDNPGKVNGNAFATDKGEVDSKQNVSCKESHEGATLSTESVNEISDDATGNIFPNKDIVLGFEDELGVDTVLSKLSSVEDDDMFLLDDEDDTGNIGLIPDDEVEKLLGLDMKVTGNEPCVDQRENKLEDKISEGSSSKLHWNAIPFGDNEGEEFKQQKQEVDGRENNEDGMKEEHEVVPQTQKKTMTNQENASEGFVSHPDYGEVSPERAPGNGDAKNNNVSPSWKRILGTQALKEIQDSVTHALATVNAKHGSRNGKTSSDTKKPILHKDKLNLKLCTGALSKALKLSAEMRKSFGDGSMDSKNKHHTEEKERKELIKCGDSQSHDIIICSPDKERPRFPTERPLSQRCSMTKLAEAGNEKSGGSIHSLDEKDSKNLSCSDSSPKVETVNLNKLSSEENDPRDFGSNGRALNLRESIVSSNVCPKPREEEISLCNSQEGRFPNVIKLSKDDKVGETFSSKTQFSDETQQNNHNKKDVSNFSPSEIPIPPRLNKKIDLTKLKMKLTPILAAGRASAMKKDSISKDTLKDEKSNSLSSISVQEAKKEYPKQKGNGSQNASAVASEQTMTLNSDSSKPIVQTKEAKKIIFPPVLNTAKLTNILKNFKKPAMLNNTSKHSNTKQKAPSCQESDSSALPEPSYKSDSTVSLRKRTRSSPQNGNNKQIESKRPRKTSSSDQSFSDTETNTDEKSVDSEDKGERSCFDCLTGIPKDMWESK